MLPAAYVKVCPRCSRECDRSSQVCANCSSSFRRTSSARILWIICGVVALLGVLTLAGVLLVVRATVTSTGAYQQALQIVYGSADARKILGDRTIPGWIFGSGWGNSQSRFVQWEVRLFGSRGSAHLYGVANEVGGVWQFSRLRLKSVEGETEVDLTPQPKRMSLPAVPASKVYLVPFGLDSGVPLDWARTYYRARFGIDVSILSPVQVSNALEGHQRKQLDAQRSLEYLQERLPALTADPSAILVAVTSRDLFIPAFSWSYAENYREDGRFAIVSSARLRPPSPFDGWNPQWYYSRIQKMISKNIAILYFGLPLSDDPTSLLCGGILSGDEADLMSESIIGSEGHWDPMEDIGEPEVNIYSAPQKPPFWRIADTRKALVDTSSQVFTADLALGLFMQRQTDLYIGGASPLQFTRVYTALDQRSRAFGIGADHSLDIFLAGEMGSYIDLSFADGGKIRFQHERPSSSGDRYVSHDSSYTSAIFQGDVWTIFRSDGSKLYFPYRPRALTQYVTVLTGFTDSRGYLYQMERDPAGDLLSVTTPAGGWLRFDYDSQHRVSRMEASTGRIVSYGYDSKGRLARVDDLKGQIETYTYDDKAEMLTADYGGKTPVLVNSYDIRGEIVAQKLQDGGIFKYYYVKDPESYRNVVEPSLMIAPSGLATYFNYHDGFYYQSLPQRPPVSTSLRLPRQTAPAHGQPVA